MTGVQTCALPIWEFVEIDVKYVPLECIGFKSHYEHYYQITAIDLYSRKRILHYPMSCSLSLRSDDRDTLADEGVHQCRLANVGITYYIYKTRPIHKTIIMLMLSDFLSLFEISRKVNDYFLYSPIVSTTKSDKHL